MEMNEKRVDFLTENFHGLHWNDGFIGFWDAVDMLCNTVKGASKVLIKGSERVAYLSKLLNREVCVVDLDTIGCPRACEWPPHPPPDRDEIDGPWPQNLGMYPYEMRLKLLLHCPHWQHRCLAEQALNARFKCALKQRL